MRHVLNKRDFSLLSGDTFLGVVVGDNVEVGVVTRFVELEWELELEVFRRFVRRLRDLLSLEVDDLVSRSSVVVELIELS